MARMDTPDVLRARALHHAATAAELITEAVRQDARTSREFMATLNLAKGHAAVAQCYAMLAGPTPPAPRRVDL